MSRRFAKALLLAALTVVVLGLVPVAQAAPPTVVACNTVVTTDVQLQNDLICTNTDGLIVGADGVKIDLNSHFIRCVDPAGYKGSCQGPGPFTGIDPTPEVGIDTNGFSNVNIFSHRPGGTIDGFDRGVWVRGPGENINVKRLIVTGPSGVPRPNPRPITQGILVSDIECPDPPNGIVHIGGGVPNGNDVSNHTEGIELENADCVNVGHNFVHDNNSDPFECHGIILNNSSNNNIHNNRVERNGENLLFDGGLTVRFAGSTNNTLTDNDVSFNNGDGISMRGGANGNQIVNNTMLANGGLLAGIVFFDAAARPPVAGANFWNENNVCNTQTVPEPPPGVCGPTETAFADLSAEVRLPTVF
jgi:parallel beta-helix repeat protein